MMSIEASLIDGFMAGTAPLLIKAVYDKFVGNAPADLRRKIEELSTELAVFKAQNLKLISDGNSQRETISILTTELTVARSEKAGMIEQIKEAGQERRAALRVKSIEVRKALADEKQCRENVSRLERQLIELRQHQRENSTAIEITSMRTEALETGKTLGDIVDDKIRAISPHMDETA